MAKGISKHSKGFNKFSTEFKLHIILNKRLKAPTGTCPKCGEPDKRMVKKQCSDCYQKEYNLKRKADRAQYKF